MPKLFAPGLLREFAHIYFLKTASPDAFRDPILLFLIQRKDRLSFAYGLYLPSVTMAFKFLFMVCFPEGKGFRK